MFFAISLHKDFCQLVSYMIYFVLITLWGEKSRWRQGLLYRNGLFKHTDRQRERDRERERVSTL